MFACYTSVKVAASSHSATDSPKKVKVQKHQKKLELGPTTNITETSFLHILNPCDHFGTNFIFDHFFTYIHNLDFFGESTTECEVQKHHQKS